MFVSDFVIYFTEPSPHWPSARPVLRNPCGGYRLLSVVGRHPACVNLVPEAVDSGFLIGSQRLAQSTAWSNLQEVS
jgi:hypothetical protein